MKQWTPEEKRRVYKDTDYQELKLLHEEVSRSKWRTQYHVQTVTGLMNDPNGFSHWNGEWHLFYQWFPYGGVHGTKHWYHVTSEDLVTWKNVGCAMIPDHYEDNSGCYSGSAYPADDALYLAYTGNCRDKDYVRHPFQLLAKIDKEGNITKQAEPLIKPQEGYTEHQRDPKIFRHLGYYYILLGAQDENKKGKLLLFRSQDIEEGWYLLGELKVRGFEDFGYMVECPDLEKIGNQWVLLFSPQGLQPEGNNFQNKFNNVYLVGKMDFDKLEFIPESPMTELDRGFDFYAAQCAFQKEYSSAGVLIAWFGVADYSYPPADDEGWAGLQTMPRELTIKNNRLIQKPVRAISKLKGDTLLRVSDGRIIEDKTLGRTPSACIIDLENPKYESVSMNLFAGSIEKGFEISYNKNSKDFYIDKGGMRIQTNTDFGTRRTVHLDNGLKSMEVFVDHSSVEIFLNDGEYVLSSRIFPTPDEHLLRMSGRDININIYQANKTVEQDFVI